MKALVVLLLAWVTAVSAAEPFGFSLRLADGVVPDVDARCVGVRLEVRDAYAVVFSDLPTGWFAQVLQENDRISCQLGIWDDGTTGFREIHARHAVPAREILKCIWIQASSIDVAEDAEPKAKPPSISGAIGFLGDRTDYELRPGSIVYRFAFRDPPSWSNHSKEKKQTAEPGATDNPDDAQRLREDH